MIRGALRSGPGRPVTHAKNVLTPFHADATRVVLPEGTSESSQLNVAR